MQFDPEVGAVVAAAMSQMEAFPATARGDALALRAALLPGLVALNEYAAVPPNVSSVDFQVEVGDGAMILARWYTKRDSAPGSAVVYAHGGGMVAGSVATYDRYVANYVEQTGVPFLSVDYRMAPDVTGTTLVDDCFAALRWFIDRADDFGVDPDRIGIMGDSGGGGVAAGVAIAARDSGLKLTKQILIYPMLDDRNIEPDPEIVAFAGWTYDNNFTGWNALLGEDRGTANVSALASPSHLEDFHGLAPAFIDVGELDIFRDESILYALNLVRAGVSTELHVRAGVPHGYDRFGAGVPWVRSAIADWHRVIQSL